MKSDEEIGRELAVAIFPDMHIRHLLNQEKYFASIGAAARKAVGEPPRMMIQGMSVEEIHSILIGPSPASTIHRLANTPAEPEPDPDAFVKEVWVRWETARLAREYPGIPASCVPFEKAYPSEQAACRAIAKWMEERK